MFWGTYTCTHSLFPCVISPAVPFWLISWCIWLGQSRKGNFTLPFSFNTCRWTRSTRSTDSTEQGCHPLFSVMNRKRNLRTRSRNEKLSFMIRCLQLWAHNSDFTLPWSCVGLFRWNWNISNIIVIPCLLISIRWIDQGINYLVSRTK